MNPIEIILEHPGPWLAWIIPILGAIMMPILGKINHKLRDYGAVFFAFLALVSCISMIPYLNAEHALGDIKLITWMTLPNGTPLEFGVLVDPLSILICNVVAFISFLIIVYSTSYMHGDPHMDRYWFLFLYFIGSMLLLVLADNLVMTLIGWEGVGLCSYGLIGYYYRDAKERWLGGPPPTKMYPPSHAGMKAFVVTGIGDVFILASIFILYQYAGTFNYAELIKHSEEWLSHMAAVPGLISIMAIFLLGGPIGKSAQFPLHEWLPEAMAGPTSVSALIHAATMVKAGVYLVARMSPIFYIGTWNLHLPEAQVYFIAIACIGAFTAFLAASQALVALELKKVLAYSTVSQIGYMMLGLGLSGLSEGAFVAGLTSGIFHLVSHALFKAALFLCAGSVIHSVETIYMSNMGGLGKYMPITKILMLLSTLSLAGIPPFSGFWSKDSIFIAGLIVGTPLAMVLYLVAAISAALTLIYSIRYIWMVFYGDKSKFIKDLEHHGHHVHEASKTMWIPIAILVIVMSGVSLLGLVGQAIPSLNPEIFIEHQIDVTLENLHVELHPTHVEGTTKLLAYASSATIILVGGIIGWLFYWTRKINSWEFVTKNKILKPIHSFLWNRWFLNDLYYLIFVQGILALGKVIFDLFEVKIMIPISDYVAGMSQKISKVTYSNIEEGIIFGKINTSFPKLILSVYQNFRKTQTGLLSINIVYIMILFAAMMIWMIYFGGL
ncbi:NADH-quinone oxidoreductase subunit L [Candidatus Bathyarchaeota archaeon]|nr:NADH-quinone oxidoreductase subunit L [Candidatus Bathyarchaeota archaeon]